VAAPASKSAVVRYCIKEGRTGEWGGFSAQGYLRGVDNHGAVRPSKRQHVVESLKDNPEMPDEELYNLDPSLAFKRDGANILRANINAMNARKVGDWQGDRQVVWICGPSGIGKTRKAWEMAEGTKAKEIMIPTKGAQFWLPPDWDSTVQTAIIDNVTTETGLSDNLICKLLDKRVTSFQVKGGHSLYQPNLVVLTSVDRPEYLFPRLWESRELSRRIDRLLVLSADD